MADDEAPVATEAPEVEENEAIEAETTPALEQAQEEAPVSEEAPPKEEAPAPPPRLKFKVRGEEREMDFDEVQEAVNKADYWARARQEMDSARFVVKQFLDKPLESWIELYEGKLGGRDKAVAEVRRVIEEFLGQELEYEHAPPEKKKQIELQRKIARYEAEEAARAAEAKSAAETASWNSFCDDVVGLLGKEGIEFDDDAIADLDAVWGAAIDLEEEITPAEAVRRVRLRQERKIERTIGKLTKNPEELGKRAPDLVKQLRLNDIAKVKAANQRPRMQPTGRSDDAPQRTPKTPRAMSPSEMDQELSRLY